MSREDDLDYAMNQIDSLRGELDALVARVEKLEKQTASGRIPFDWNSIDD